jgi:hypothetical protein
MAIIACISELRRSLAVCRAKTEQQSAESSAVIETHEQAGDFRELMQSETARHGPMIRCIRPGNCGLRRRYSL